MRWYLSVRAASTRQVAIACVLRVEGRGKLVWTGHDPFEKRPHATPGAQSCYM